MSKQYPYLFIGSSVIALLMVGLSWFSPQLLSQYEYGIAGALILLLGMPHGATDYLIYRKLTLTSKQRAVVFIFSYILLMVIYGVLWMFFPVFSLLIFIVLSVYHFGQSNWEHLLSQASRIERLFVHMAWGSFVLAWPLLLHQETTVSILSPLLQMDLEVLSEGVVNSLLFGLLGINLGWMLSAWFRGFFSIDVILGELLNLLILGGLFLYTPLLIGFAIYFTCWHSLSSIGDQIRFFQQDQSDYYWFNYLRDAIPFSVAALLGLAGWLFWQAGELGLSELNMGWLFAFIAMLTLPHMILIDRLFAQVKPA